MLLARPSPRSALRLATGAARAASTVTFPQGETLSPAVAFLVHKNHIEPAIYARIPRSGPKNRLLKGDVIRFLADPAVIDNASATADVEASLVPQAYYGRDVVVTQLAELVRKLNESRHLGVSASDFFARAVVLALKAVPDASARWSETLDKKEIVASPSVSLSRASPLGVSSFLVKASDDIGAVKLSKAFKDQGLSARNAAAAFSVFDHVLSPFSESTPYLRSTHLGILAISGIRRTSRQAPAQVSSFDLIDILAGPRPRVTAARPRTAPTHAPSNDPIDILARPTRGAFDTGSDVFDPAADYVVRVDLVTDPRAVTAKVAEKFLSEFEVLITKRVKDLV
ncbi:hypothetical protein BDK51DRAFT_33923 [Blyttiomyces helicus]|uniref:Peripheral subunit-binding (PSBD) domain-containing protein n=1 Tax=Blyttiomyces helicus TaxID=388810 RepID=A0A4P9WMI0_9FUNG|nr:hypothetical protein BDK51DRAFT_33923 [Blyttiomyces helicus]|eukprot:RKO91936.1 hypothetical protein BDK51DRAFT_33923 [Blyttiomyces helicus]